MNNCKASDNINRFSSVLLAKEALRRGIKLKHINYYQDEHSFIELNYKNHFEHILGSKISMPSTSSHILSNKALTKDFLGRKRINCTRGKMFHCKDREGVGKFVMEIGWPVVFKKYNGTHGYLVFLGICSIEEGRNILDKYFRKEKYVLIEKEFQGKEFRFIATREKVLAIAFREPANVVGDGKRTIKELIAAKNRDPQRGADYTSPLMKIKTDNCVKEKLRAQNLDLGSVVSKGKKIYLRNNSNISTGGDSIDVTDEMHPQFKKIATQAIRAVPGLLYAGIDMMIKGDISKKPGKDDYAILEMNASPGIFIHHFPYYGKSRDVAGGIIDILFPETKR